MLSETEMQITIVTPTQNRTVRSEEHTSELQSLTNLVCRLLLEKKNKNKQKKKKNKKQNNNQHKRMLQTSHNIN